MRVIQISEVLQMDFGEKVPSTKGVIAKVYPRTEGKNSIGHWSIQNIFISDPTDKKVQIKVKLFDKDEIPESWKGKILYIESGIGEKGDLKGVELAKDTYKLRAGEEPKKMIEVKAGTATLAPSGGPAQTRQSDPEPERAPSAHVSPLQAPTTTTAASTAPSRAEQLRAELAKAEADEKRAREEAARAAAKPKPKEKTPEEIKADKLRARMLEILGPYRRDAYDYAVGAGIIQEGEKLENWPSEKLPDKKEAMDEILAKVIFMAATRTVNQASTFLDAKLNGARMVLSKMDALAEERKAAGHPFTPEHFQGLASTIFIAGDRAGQFDGLPTKDFEKFWLKGKKIQ